MQNIIHSTILGHTELSSTMVYAGAHDQTVAEGSVVDITISDPPLEEVIAKIYQTQDLR